MNAARHDAWVAARDAAIVPVGAALAVGLTLAAALTPRWSAGGAPWASEYPKNVEISATLGAVLTGAATAWLATSRPARRASALLAGLGYAWLAWRWPAVLPFGGAALLLAAGFAVALDRAAAAPPTAASRGEGPSLAWLTLLGAMLFVASSGPLVIDVFHHGEVLLTARDLLAGGRPFVSLAWPHGAGDSGVAALWILATGKLGSSAVVLTEATTSALSAATLYLLLRSALGNAAATAFAVWGVSVAISVLRPPYGSFALRTSGLMVMSAAALALAAGRRPRPLWAGAAAALGYVLRIDAGLYGGVAVAAVLVARQLLAGGTTMQRAAQALQALAAFGTGAAALLLASYAGLGWPDAIWYRMTLGTLPRLHSMATGRAYPWPTLDRGEPVVASALGVLLPLVLLSSAARPFLSQWRDANRQGGHPDARLWLLIFLAVFSLGGLRTALGRSDTAHILHWTLTPLAASLMLCTTAWWTRMARAPRRVTLGCALLAVALGATIWRNPHHLAPQLLEHLRPNAPIGVCADTMFTAREAAAPYTARFIAETCVVERLLRQHGVQRVLFNHAAPWYQVRFDVPLLSPDYSLNRAYLPADQRHVVDELRRHGTQAMLNVRGYSALDRYDVHNMYSVPVLEAYLRARRDGAPVLATPLGDLVLWDEAATPAAPAAPGALDEQLSATVDSAIFDPATGFLELRGWAADLTTGQPLAGLTLQQPSGDSPELRYGLPRPDVESYLHSRAAKRTGWWAVTRSAPATWQAGELALELVAEDGRHRRLPLSALAVHDLPPLDGPAWRDVGAQVEAAAALGRADRAAALAR
ncbi:MAG: hypothetical protein ABI629_09510 [bacterium]